MENEVADEIYSDDGRKTRKPISKKRGGNGNWGHHPDLFGEEPGDSAAGGERSKRTSRRKKR